MKCVHVQFYFLLYHIISLSLIHNTDQVAINIDGDLTIVGLFQIHESENEDCGLGVKASSVITSEAVKWYIEGLNKHGKLPFKIGFEGYETCRLKHKAAEIAIKVMDRALANESIVGIVGPEFSSEAEVISPILSSARTENRLVQVGFSTTATRLSDDRKYPNFVRVVPNDDVQVEVMIQTMKELEWNRIAIIFEDDTYGRDASSRLTLRAKQESICISMDSGIPVNNGVSANDILTLLNNIIYGSTNSPSINGIVYIGFSLFARSIFISLDNTGFSTVPIVMLSEGINMQTSVFKNLNGFARPAAKGSLALAPSYLEVTEFAHHWKAIFTNKTYFQKESLTNPWLTDLYHEITECENRNCEFAELTESEFGTAFEAQPLYVQYSIIAAHALVKEIKELQEKHCVNSGFCDAFKTKFRTGDLLENLKEIDIDMSADFQWKLDSLSGRKLQLTENGTNDIVKPNGQSNYQVFNYRKANEVSTEFVLKRISDYADMDLVINKDELRDYTIQGAERTWPDVRKAQCNIETKCEECIPILDIHESFIFEPGDVYVVGVVAVFDSDSNGVDGCGDIRKVSGYQTAESMRFAVDKVNEKTGDFSNFFPGVQIGLIVLNSCNNPLVVQRKIHELFKNGVKMANGSAVDIRNKVIGFVGDISSSISIAMAELLSRLKFVQISFASTSRLLSDRSKYPYFMRVVTPDDAQAKAMIRIIQELNADFVQIVYSTGAYGEAGKDKIKEAAYQNKICVVQEIPVEEYGSAYAIFEKLRREAHARIVIIFLQSHRIYNIMSALVSQIDSRGEFMFIGSEAWARKKDPLVNDEKQILLGSYTLALEMYQDNELRSYIQNITPKPYSQNPWSLIYLQTKRNCFFDFSFDKTQPEKCSSANDYSTDPNFELDSWDTSAFVAVKSLLIAANAFLKERCGSTAHGLCAEFTNNPKGLTDAIRATKLDLDGSGNKIKVFNENGDGNIGYRIYNIQKDDDPQNLIYVEVGRYPLGGTFTFEKSMTVHPTGAQIVSTCPNKKACSGCFGTETIVDKTEDEAESVDVGMLVLGVLLAVAVIIVVILVLVTLRLRKVRAGASEIYLTPTIGSEGGRSLTRQEAIGSEEFSVITP
ncbi:uncharacterized protein LOC123540489 [Mercenaria mercenaria]|uniref:uncharacterized protein LOC123540489 n=1 Tax=Mercenaria mercenaria TaxID=6596 RepID=UPI00234F2CC5|nr:uncharacterized protein LOC123540489 [Mercenaria mercenaria]